LTITKSATTGTIPVGGSMTYTIQLTNGVGGVAADAAFGLHIQDNLPAGFTPTGNWSCSPAPSCVNFTPSMTKTLNQEVNVGVGAAAAVQMSIVGTATTVGSLANTATVTTPTTFTAAAGSTLSSLVTRTIRALTGRLTVAKTVSTAPITKGGVNTMQYTVTVVDGVAGPAADSVSGLTLNDSLPANFAPDGNWTCSAGPGSSCTNFTPSQTKTLSQAIDVGTGAPAVVIFTISGHATASGTLANTATIVPPASFSPASGSTLSSTVNKVVSPVGTLGITIGTDRPSVSRTANAAARTVTYTVTMSNPSTSDPVTAANAAFGGFSGTSLGTFSNVSCTPTAGSSCGTGTISATAAPGARNVTIAPGGTVTFKISAVVSNTLLANTVLAKTVTVTGTTTNTINYDPVVHSATANVTVTA
jgi:hypothetical protein